MDAPLPIAAGLDWLEGLLPLLFLLYWIGSQVVGLFRAAGGDRKPARAAPRPPAVPRGGAEVSSDELERQIEQFLRQSTPRAAERPRPAATDRDTPRRKRSAGGSPPPLPATAASSMAAAPRSGRGLGALEARGTDVARHVHDAFAHDLGRLTTSIGDSAQRNAAAAPVAMPATDLAALVRSPATLRQLFIVREVLDRPVERW